MQNSFKKIQDHMIKHGLSLVTVESCTGGLIAAKITDIPGSSQYFERGYITYSNDAKVSLGVDKSLIEKYGAVRAEVALSMAKSGQSASNSSICISCTGVAGPDGGTKDKPVGLVFIGFADDKGKSFYTELKLKGTRLEIRKQTMKKAAEIISSYLFPQTVI
jgi:PncC family amidohydrolase